VLFRPTRPVLATGLFNAGIIVVWLVSRTSGAIVGPEASLKEAVGFPDVLSTVLEAVIVVGIVALLVRPSLGRRRISRVVGASIAGFVALGLAIASTVSVTPRYASAHNHYHGPSGVAPNIAASYKNRKVDTKRLIASTKRDIAQYDDVRNAERAGYQYIGDWPFEHYINWTLVAGPDILDSKRPESLVYVEDTHHVKHLVAAMYFMPWGTTATQVPNVAGAPWHGHPDLCWNDDMKEVGSTRSTGNGKCNRGTLIALPPMIHVWTVANDCGPFANIQNSAEISTRIILGRRLPSHNPNECKPPSQGTSQL
jgi:hypothetical protein